MMHWIFNKENEDCKIMIKNVDDTIVDFSYIDMIKKLYDEKEIRSVEFDGDFSDEEKKSVEELIAQINQHVKDFFEKVDESSSEIIE